MSYLYCLTVHKPFWLFFFNCLMLMELVLSSLTNWLFIKRFLSLYRLHKKGLWSMKHTYCFQFIWMELYWTMLKPWRPIRSSFLLQMFSIYFARWIKFIIAIEAMDWSPLHNFSELCSCMHEIYPHLVQEKSYFASYCLPETLSLSLLFFWAVFDYTIDGCISS